MRFSLIWQAQVSCLAVAKRFDEVSYFIDQTLACLDRAPRVMWADNQIWNITIQERLPIVRRLLGQHIDSCARNLSGAQCFHQSDSFTIPPRAVLIRIAPDFILFSSRWSMRLFVLSLSGQCKEITSDVSINSSNDTPARRDHGRPGALLQ